MLVFIDPAAASVGRGPPGSLVPVAAGLSPVPDRCGRSHVALSPAVPEDGDSPPPGDPSQGCSVPRTPEPPSPLRPAPSAQLHCVPQVPRSIPWAFSGFSTSLLTQEPRSGGPIAGVSPTGVNGLPESPAQLAPSNPSPEPSLGEARRGEVGRTGSK